MQIAAVVPAAGSSTRMGGANKLLLPWKASTVIRQVIDALTASGVEEIVVTLGHEAETMRQALGKAPVRILHNTSHQQGMSTSILQGVKMLPDKVDGIMIALADMPEIRPATIAALCNAFHSHAGKYIVVPVHDEQPGHPVIFPGALRNQLLRLEGDRGAKDVIEQNHDSVLRVDVNDPGVCRDIDSMEDYKALRVKG